MNITDIKLKVFNYCYANKITVAEFIWQVSRKKQRARTESAIQRLAGVMALAKFIY